MLLVLPRLVLGVTLAVLLGRRLLPGLVLSVALAMLLMLRMVVMGVLRRRGLGGGGRGNHQRDRGDEYLHGLLR